MRAYRGDKLASTIREVVSEAIASKLQDPRISPLASVTRVEVSGDLQVAKVHVSVLGRSADGRRTLAGLTHAAGRIQRLLARQLTMRRCPELRFLLDESLKRAAETLKVLQENAPDDQPEPGDGDGTTPTVRPDPTGEDESG